MKIETLNICDINKNLAHSKAVLTCYLNENSLEYCADRKRKAVIICPGGGYRMVSDREAAPVALAFLNEDVQAFVLTYSVAPVHYPEQLYELAAAMAYVKSHYEQYNIQKDKVAVCGFSAGAHLAASLGTMWDVPHLFDTLHLNADACMPEVMMLCYPVITSGEFAHRDSFNNLLGEDCDEALVKYLSLENRVTDTTRPCFIWHTFEDTCVPCYSSLYFATALKNHNVPFELTIYESGPHGLSMCNASTANGKDEALINSHDAKWFCQCMEWWNAR
ncbi:MAG: alpha/beta hydrolase [Oscillospiraceae bacterium]